MAVEAPERRARADLAAEDGGLDPPRQDGEALVLHEGARGDGEDVVEFLLWKRKCQYSPKGGKSSTSSPQWGQKTYQSALLRLGQPQEDHDEGTDVETGVESECTGGGHGGQHARERDGQDGGPEETSGDGPGHADLSVRQREHLGRVGERDGSFAGRVEGGEEVDEEGDEAQMRGTRLRDQVAQARREQSPRHLREREEQERAAAKGVDGPDGGPREDEVDQPKPPGREERLGHAGAGLLEDGRRVEGDDVDAAHLLRDHDGERGERRPAHARDREQLDEPRHVVALLLDQSRLHAQLCVDVVQVARGLELRVAEALE